ncbi:3,4-dihydroxyphenylacetate 2,3-dioxygenase [Streptomyces sp. NPDC002926]
MGEIVGAGLLSHVPTIVLPQEDRFELNNGKEITLVTGLQELRRDVFGAVGYDTVVVLDSHWATTVEFVITAQERRAGLFTSEELPRGMRRMPYDFPGDPELAHNVVQFAGKHGTWITAADDAWLPIHYATVNLWKYLGEGLPDKRWVTIGVCQTGDMEDHLRLGRALADGIAATPGRKVLVIASGALSHTFWPLRELRDHEPSDPSHIFSAEAREADRKRIAWFKEGRHAKVLETMPEFWKHKPEAKFFHYLMMAGALGEGECIAGARQYGEYENAIGTGQAHLWFDRPAEGWTGTGTPNAAPRLRHDPHHHRDPHADQES